MSRHIPFGETRFLRTSDPLWAVAVLASLFAVFLIVLLVTLGLTATESYAQPQTVEECSGLSQRHLGPNLEVMGAGR